MMVPKVYNLSTWVYELYHLSPADSVLARRSLLGYNQLGALNVLSMSVSISWILPLLPAGSCLVGPVVLFLLLLMYLFTAVGTLLPRLLMGRMIRAKKEEEMETLQVRLNELLPQLPALTMEEYEKMKRLQETQDAICASPQNLLPLDAILHTAGALLLSTVTVLVTAFPQE